jgi:hypothetical protein
MRRLVRHAEESGRVIAVATGSAALANRARHAGLPVSRRPESVRWDSGGRRVLGIGRWRFVAPSLGVWFQFLSIVVVFGVLAAVALAVGPSADVIVSPPTESVSGTVNIRAAIQRTEVDLENMRLPAREVTGTEVLTIALPATGAAAAGSTTKTVSPADVAAATALVEQLKNSQSLRSLAARARPRDDRAAGHPRGGHDRRPPPLRRRGEGDGNGHPPGRPRAGRAEGAEAGGRR